MESCPKRKKPPPRPIHWRDTLFVCGSILRGRSNTVAHSASAPWESCPPAPGMPTGIVAITFRLFSSTRLTLPSPLVQSPNGTTARRPEARLRPHKYRRHRLTTGRVNRGQNIVFDTSDPDYAIAEKRVI